MTRKLILVVQHVRGDMPRHISMSTSFTDQSHPDRFPVFQALSLSQTGAYWRSQIMLVFGKGPTTSLSSFRAMKHWRHLTRSSHFRRVIQPPPRTLFRFAPSVLRLKAVFRNFPSLPRRFHASGTAHDLMQRSLANIRGSSFPRNV